MAGAKEYLLIERVLIHFKNQMGLVKLNLGIFLLKIIIKKIIY